MYLLYVDDSGSVGDSGQKVFVLSGVCLFERQGYWISTEMDKIAARFDPATPNDVELHGNPMYGGKKFWRRFPAGARHQAIKDSLQIFASSHPSNRIFSCIINKAAVSPNDPVELAFEQLASRFDQYLMRLHRKGDTQRGILIFDESTYETTLQKLATDFRTIGHTWGVLRNLAEVPLFLDSKASRLIQLADLVAYAAYRAYEHGDEQFFEIIRPRLDTEAGIVHGLFERL